MNLQSDFAATAALAPSTAAKAFCVMQASRRKVQASWHKSLICDLQPKITLVLQQRPTLAAPCRYILPTSIFPFTMPEQIGLFGGTFDPPHLGHLILAAEALEQLGLSRLLWILTPQPPHKGEASITPPQIRLQMLNLALQDEPRFKVCRVEMDRPGPHYTVETLRLLQAEYPQAAFTFLMGGDSLRDLPGWREPAEILRLTSLGVMRRPGDTIDLPALEQRLPGLRERLRFLEAPLLEISSRQIRQRVQQGRAFRYYLPSAVYVFLQQHSLYRSGPPASL